MHCKKLLTLGKQEVLGEEKKLVITEKILFDCLYGKREMKLIDLKDKKRKITTESAISKKMKSLWCEECCKYTEDISCPLHHSSQRSYALKSFPPEVQLCTSSIPGHEYGACAGQRIPCGTWIGPYEGKLIDSKTIDYSVQNTYIWEIYHKNGEFSHFLDGSDESCSSWMRFIRCARYKNEQNMAVFQFGENIYYRAIKEINIGEEILVWYDQSYSQFLGIPFTMSPQDKKVGAGTDTNAADKRLTAQHSLPNTVLKQQIVPAIQKPRFQSQPAPYQIPPMLKQQSPLQSPSSTVPSPLPSPLSTIPVAYKLPTKSLENTQTPRTIEQQRLSQQYHYTFSTEENNMMVNKTEPPLLQVGAAATMKVASHQWSVGEVKENVPIKTAYGSRHEYQTKVQLSNANQIKQQPLQSLSTSINSSVLQSSPFPESKTEQDIVSSTVQTREEASNMWKCGQCQKSFSQRLILQIHVCTGALKKPYQCGRCPLSFSDPSKLREHVVIHNNDRPFKCGFCGRSFAGATTLNNHMRMHTGERPFSCEKCGNTFVTATQLSRHSKQPSECRAMQATETKWTNNQAIAVE